MQTAVREKDDGILVFSVTMLLSREVTTFERRAAHESRIGTSTNREASSVSMADQVALDVEGVKYIALQVLTFKRLSKS